MLSPWGSPQHSHFTGETREEKAHSRPTAYTSQPSTLSPPHPTHTETLPWGPRDYDLHLSSCFFTNSNRVIALGSDGDFQGSER